MKIVFSSALGLVVSDGTVAGTSVIKAANPLAGGFDTAYRMVSYGADVLFVADAGTVPGPDGGYNNLWITDGTAAGTSLVETLPDNTPYSDPPTQFSTTNLIDLTVVGGHVVFDYTPGDPYGGALSYAFWTTNGTASGTNQVLPTSIDIHASGVLSDGAMVFSSYGVGLEVTDGTATGTTLLRAGSTSVGTGSAISSYGFGNLGSILVYGASSSGGPNESTSGNSSTDQIWRTDGTVAGTVLVKTIPAAQGATASVDIGSFESLGDKAVFSVFDGLNFAASLWVTDGTSGGTFQIPGITNPRLAADEPLLAGMAGPRLIIMSDQGVVATDGTAAGTQVVLAAASAPAGTGIMAQLGSDVLFVGQNPDQIWETDGTAAGTHLAVQLPGSGPGTGITSMTTVGTQVLFEYVATSTSSGAVWTTDGTQAGTALVLSGANAAFIPGAFAQLVTCFLAGTRIATPCGEVPVEQLLVGGEVLTRCGEARPITWIGVGRVLATRGRRSAATPVILRRGALADNVPHQDLRVTKGHSFYLDNVLIPVEFLVNHRSILWDDHAQEVVHYHIELASHDVLLANGAPAESYRDDGNRWLFQNANSGWSLAPQVPCAPVLTGGPVVDAIWRRLLERSGPRQALPLTRDPDLHLLVDGKRIDAIERRDEMQVFPLPVRPRSVRICSRAAVPLELGISRDDRSLGVAMRRIVLAQSRQQRAIEADTALLTDGYHAFEPDNSIRWTDGNAAVPAELFAGMNGPAMLILHLRGITQYLDEGIAARAA